MFKIINFTLIFVRFVEEIIVRITAEFGQKILTNEKVIAILAYFQVLIKSGKADDKADNYMLVVDTQKSWDHRETDKGGGIQRILDRDEKVLHAQSKWKGSGRFILRKNSNVVSRKPIITHSVFQIRKLRRERSAIGGLRPVQRP